jgi:tetratricopeptide (TPR) repeat protein
VLHGQRALLLLDDAAGREHVEALIPPPGCVLLVTSRERFHLPGAAVVRVEPLSREEARRLLLSVAPRIGGQADVIADLCGRLPLALRLAAGALAERVDVDAADYTRRLSDIRERVGLVEASFGMSYGLLTPAGQELWRKLAVFQGPFDAEAAAYVWGVEAEPGRKLLSEMVRLSLLDWDAEASRYRLHDLVRLYAGERLLGAERRETYVRYVNYYGALLQEANDLYALGGFAMARGVSNFDAHWDNIRGAQAWAREHAAADEEAARMCNAFPNAGAYVLNLRQHPLERIRWLEDALVAARGLNLRQAEGAHMANMGIVYTSMGRPRRAIELLELSLTIDREFGDRKGEGHLLGSLANAYSALGEVGRAIDLYEQDLAILREFGDRHGQGTVLANLGHAYAAAGDAAKALAHYEEALAIFRESGDLHGEGSVLGSLGLFYSDRGDEAAAVRLHQEALTIARELGDAEGEQQAVGNLGQSLYRLGDHQGALDHHLRQLRLARERDDLRGEAHALAGMGSAYYSLGDHARSGECHERALALFREMGDRMMEGRILGNWGNLCAGAGERDRALEFYGRQSALARETGDRRGEANALWNTGWVFSLMGDAARAIEYGEEGLRLFEEVGDARNAAMAQRHLARWRKGQQKGNDA